jgi:hypothetical protein
MLSNCPFLKSPSSESKMGKMKMMQNYQPMKAQYSIYLRSYLGSFKLHGFINGMLRIP